MNSVIQQAVTHADHLSHGGAGYTLRIFTMTNTAIEVQVFKFEGKNCLSTMDNNPVFFAEGGVSFVKVLW